MASIDKRANGKWRARYRERPGGPQRTRQFDRKVDAQRWLDAIGGDLARGTYVDPASGRVTFGAYAEQWRLAQVHRPSTAARVETVLRCHVLPHLGDRPLGAIRTSELQQWAKGRSEVLAPSTLRTVHQLMSAIFAAAVVDRVIASSPAAGVKLPRPELDEVAPMTRQQVEAMAAAVPDRYGALIVAGAATGMRQGELLGLTVDRVDFLRRTIRVDRQLVTVSGQAPYLAPPKTPSSTRTIPAPAVALEALGRHLEVFPAGDEGLIFTDDRGQAIRRPHIGHIWRKAAGQSGVEGHTFHDLRHFTASALIAAGSSVKAVQRFLGHTSAKTTLDVYGHLWPDEEDRTRSALDAALAAEDSLRTDTSSR
ncbi:MAG TPA: tyrosine-type recombinase/integrase [Acidimicrobiales bacterium]|nr:tyrosine-type recombinase/integrase [Acidimicrobiales bacterium]